MLSCPYPIDRTRSLTIPQVLALVIYTGFIITVPSMGAWFGWIRWINPLFYGMWLNPYSYQHKFAWKLTESIAFEIMMSNEMHGHDYVCSSIVPNYSPNIGSSWICTVVGAVAGEFTVSGDSFIEQSYQYSWSHVWRNFGILVAFLIFALVIYLVACEFNSSTASTAEALVFQRGRVPAYMLNTSSSHSSATMADEEMPGGAGQKAESAIQDVEGGAPATTVLEPQRDIFTWRDVVYDIHIKKEERRLLERVSGWVKPGTLTALMGVSGAGKTTLLDVLAQRTTMGVITGDMFVNGKPLDASFQRKTGYVQQQDLHLDTSTVRESLRFSAMLRQPPTVSKAEKYAFVEDVIQMLNMADFADAVVGVPGQGLNVEQRKLLTIGTELAAKPKLLLFLDEPTSGLDSQSSWAIVSFLRKLADSGQAVLCTVHQPSSILFQQYDRLLFLAKGGKTVYFGNIGANSETLLDYFHSHGALRHCGPEENPAEYMLDVVNNGTNADGADWHSVWLASKEHEEVDLELDRIHAEKLREPTRAEDNEAMEQSEFAMPFRAQLIEVTTRVFQQYWRMPSYIFSKFALGVLAGLFIGFSFYNGGGTLAGMQNVLFAVFQIVAIFSTVVQQIQPHFITQRSLYEVRERPSKAYSWKAFMIASIVVEIPFQIITGILIWACFYFPVVGAGQSVERQALMMLFCVQLFIYASTYAHMTVAAVKDEQTAGALVGLIMLMSSTCSITHRDVPKTLTLNSDVLRRTADSHRASRLLDLDVLSFSFFLLDIRHRVDHAARPRHRVLRRRDVHLRPPREPDVRDLHGRLHERRRRRRRAAEPRGDRGVSVLHRRRGRSVPCGRGDILGGSVEELWDPLGLYPLQHCRGGVYILAVSGRQEEAE